MQFYYELGYFRTIIFDTFANENQKRIIFPNSLVINN